ncbi:TPR repeat protein [Rhodopseudomonas julia]|uniref:TPR repeat protein n=1 Tax=Rhodopseudomonas julia TaxID=200617 RepID=A0ABU0C953_9BRAD|nr:tetratricopeptide repeat protein [Rhodopseudomonas julia]MDQ0327055.1 TPR repeat protein [Rhodopseudomonas julia]
MRISSVLPAACLAVAMATPAFAFDPDMSAREAFREGYLAYKQGHTAEALEALSYAADKGHTAALWKLGRIYATGDGVSEDDAHAFRIFAKIANDYADGNPRGSDARFVSDAFVALAGYFRDGIVGTVVADEGKARRFYSYAASYFADPEAQFQLGMMYLNGRGGEKNDRQAARWLKLAADKGHAQAQAEFGRLLFDGIGIRRNAVKGLMWLSIARNSYRGDDAIQSLHEEAFAAASENDRRTAMALAEDYLAKSKTK